MGERSAWVLMCLCAATGTAGAADDDVDLGALDLEALMQVEVTGVTRTEEPLAEVPASVIVLTRDDLAARGYRQLSDLLDDLPGMDTARAWGDHWYANYVRGHRTIYGTQYLVLVDGMIFNDLTFHDDETTLASFPLTAVERVEIIYGPVSAMYGANAMAGVINVVTARKPSADGTWTAARIAGGSLDRRIVDATVLHQRGNAGVRLATRIESGSVDDRTSESYEYTKRSYYLDRRLWGGFVDNPRFAGFQSQHHLASVDARMWLGDVEVGGTLLSLVTGYGVDYAGDRVLNGLEWHSNQLSLHATHTLAIGECGESVTTLRWAKTAFPGDSSWIDGYQDPVLGRVVGFTYWQSVSDAWSVSNTTTIATRVDGLGISAGAVFEEKDLQKAYETTGALRDGLEPVAYTPVADVDAATYAYPDAPSPARRPENRLYTEDLGGFVEATYRPRKRQRFHLGFRLDHDSRFGFAPTLRAGWVGRFGPWVARALYGEAYQEPTPRHLYGGWTGSGSDPDLDPETSRTAELGASYTRSEVSVQGSLYGTRSNGTIEAGAASSVARNVGDRSFVGAELATRAHLAPAPVDRLDLWLYYTRILHNEETTEDEMGVTATGRIGDLAINKVQLGATARIDHLTATLRGRLIGRRPTVATNPVGAVDRFATFDLHAAWDSLGIDGLALELSVYNLTDNRYFHPGLNDASAGTEPGRFEPDGTYIGSGGYYNSLLPQPGISVLAGLSLERW